VVENELGLKPTFEHSDNTGNFTFGDNTTDLPTILKCAALCDAIWFSDTFYRKWHIDGKKSELFTEENDYITLFEAYETQYYSLVWEKILQADKEGVHDWLCGKTDGIRKYQVNPTPFNAADKVCYLFCDKYEMGVIFCCNKNTFDIWLGRAEGDSGEVSSEFWTFIQECKDLVRYSFTQWQCENYPENAKNTCDGGDCTCKPFGYMGWGYGSYDLGYLLETFL
jgi:hypothetical protein